MKLGTPVVCVATEAFLPLARIEAKAWGWEVPVATIKHPLGGVPGDQLGSRAKQVVDFILERARGQQAGTLAEPAHAEASPLLDAPADPWAFYDFIQTRGWGDGLPVLPPTPERVARMLRRAEVPAATKIGQLPPEKLLVTAQDLAANAVMAGLPDAAFSVVLAAIRAALQEQFNLLGVMVTTHPCGIAVVVSGPAARELGMNAGASLYGPGNRINAGIGRAVRLSLQNLGHAWPGPVDKSTQGNPAKYSYCFAENLDESPWGAYHTDRGFDKADSTVTVLAAEGPHNMHDAASSTADNFLQYVVGSMTHCGHNNLYKKGDLMLVLSPEHSQMLARDGWTRDAVREHLFERVQLPARAMGREAFQHFTSRWPGRPPVDFETTMMALAEKPEHIHIAVAGGPGKHSSWLPTFGHSYSGIERLP